MSFRRDSGVTTSSFELSIRITNIDHRPLRHLQLEMDIPLFRPSRQHIDHIIGVLDQANGMLAAFISNCPILCTELIRILSNNSAVQIFCRADSFH
jgi:hypothetical protein